MSLTLAIIVTIIEAFGATMLGVFGFGINLLVAPLLVLIDPRFAPTPIVFASLFGSALVMLRERGNIDRAAVSWALAGRIPGTMIGALVVLTASSAYLRPIVGFVVLAAVVVSVIGGEVKRNKSTLIVVGIASGIMNMIAGLGGTPFGLICHDLPGPVQRPTLALYVFLGGILSGFSLLIIGKIDIASLRLTALLLPGLLLGFVVSRFFIPLADKKNSARIGVLTIATAGAVGVIVRGLW